MAIELRIIDDLEDGTEITYQVDWVPDDYFPYALRFYDKYISLTESDLNKIVKSLQRMKRIRKQGVAS